MGRRSESTEGGRESVGEVGREELRFARRLPLDFLSLLDEAEPLVSSGIESAGALYAHDPGAVDCGRTSLSTNGCGADEENDPILCRISVGAIVEDCLTASASSNVRVRGLGPPR